jgi:hypothetical protein
VLLLLHDERQTTTGICIDNNDFDLDFCGNQ